MMSQGKVKLAEISEDRKMTSQDKANAHEMLTNMASLKVDAHEMLTNMSGPKVKASEMLTNGFWNLVHTIFEAEKCVCLVLICGGGF